MRENSIKSTRTDLWEAQPHDPRCASGVEMHRLARRHTMTRQSISLTDPNSEWLHRKVNIDGEYRSNSEAVNDLVRKAREIEAIRAHLAR